MIPYLRTEAALKSIETATTLCIKCTYSDSIFRTSSKTLASIAKATSICYRCIRCSNRMCSNCIYPGTATTLQHQQLNSIAATLQPRKFCCSNKPTCISALDATSNLCSKNPMLFLPPPSLPLGRRLRYYVFFPDTLLQNILLSFSK
jgi:hypothetical protein